MWEQEVPEYKKDIVGCTDNRTSTLLLDCNHWQYSFVAMFELGTRQRHQTSETHDNYIHHNNHL